MTSERSLASYIDHTLLAASATPQQVITLCDEARQFEFKAVCVNSVYVPLVKAQLKGSEVLVCSVVGFPLGAMHSLAKVAEAQQAISDGADEIDMVVPLGSVLSGDWDVVREDISAVHRACGGKPLKVIFETCLLDHRAIEQLCSICSSIGVAFVKTSTGFSTGGATQEVVSQMRQQVAASLEVKASGGIRDREAALAMIDAGATRLGTSAGVAIVSGGTGSAAY